MKRRLLSFFLALVMVLGLIPAVSATGTSDIGVRETDWNGSSFEEWDHFQNPMYVQYHFNKRVSFYYGTQSNNQLLTGITNVYVDDPSILDYTYEDTPTGKRIFYFTGKEIGTTTLTVVAASGTYTMPVEVVYPAMGAYSEPRFDLNYFIEDEFAYTNSNNEFYFFSDFQITNCYVESRFENNFDIDIVSDSNGSYAKVEIIDFDGLDGECPRFECSGIDRYNNPRNAGSHYLTFVDGTPAIGYVEVWYDNNQLVYDNRFCKQLDMGMGNDPRIVFGHGTSSDYDLLTDVRNVTSADENIVTVELRDVDGQYKIWRIQSEGLGSTHLNIETSSGTYQLPVHVGLPRLGMYSSPTRSAANLISRQFTYSDTNKTFYLIFEERDFTLDDAWVQDSKFSSNFTFTPVNSNCIRVDIVKTDGLSGKWIDFRCQVADANGNTSGFGTHSVGADFINGNPAPGFRYIEWQGDEIVPRGEFRDRISESPGSGPSLVFYHGTSDSHSPLDVASVTVANPAIAEAEYWRDTQNGLPAYDVTLKNPGTTEIIVTTKDNEEYRIPVEVRVIAGYFFTEPQFDAQYLSSSYDITSVGDTFYFVIDPNFNLEEIVPNDQEYADAFEITYGPNKAYAAIKVVKPSLLPSHRVFFDVYLNEGGSSWRNGYGVWVNNKVPAPGFRYIEWQGDEIVPRGEFETSISGSPGSNPSLVFYHGTSDSHSPLDVASVTVANPAIAEVEYWRDTQNGLPAYEVTLKNPGTTEIIVTTKDNEEYRIPVEARVIAGYFFTQPQFDAQYLSSSYDITSVGDTFYFVIDPNLNLEEIVPNDQEYADAFEITYGPNKAYAAIKVVKPSLLPSHRVSFDVYLNDGDSSWHNGYGVWVNNEVPALGIKFARWDNGNLATWSDFSSNFSDGFGSNPAVVFYYGTPNNHTVLNNIKSVTVDDPNLAKIEFWQNTVNGEPCYKVTFLKPGQTVITVETADGETYSIPLSINLYNAWFFDQTTFDADHAIRDFALTTTSDTFYIVSRPGVDLTKLEIEQEFAGAFTVTQPSDEVYAIKVTDPSKLPSGDYRIEFYIEVLDGNRSDWEWLYFLVRNEIPTAGIRYAWTENNVFDGYSDFCRSVYVRVGSSPITPYYGTDTSNSPMTNVLSMESDAPSLFTLTKSSDTPASGGVAYFIEVSDPNVSGTGNLLVKTSDGTVHQIPVTVLPPLAAAYDDKNDTAHNGYEFIFTENTREFYVKPVEAGLKIASLNLNFPAPFSTEISPDGTWARVRLEDPSQIGPFGQLWMQLDIETPQGMEWCSFFVQYENRVSPPAIPFSPVSVNRYPHWTHSGPGMPNELNEGDTIHVAVPVENKTSTDQEIRAMMAVYSASGKMLALRAGTITIPANGSDDVHLEVDLTGISNADHIRLFMTDSNFLPISTVFTLT